MVEGSHMVPGEKNLDTLGKCAVERTMSLLVGLLLANHYSSVQYLMWSV